MTAAEEQEHQDGLKRVKIASTGNIATASHVDDQKDENQENPKLNSEENPNGGDVTKAETSIESSIKMERVKYDEDEEVKSDKTGNKRRFMAEERKEQQEGSKRAKNDQSSAGNIPSTGHDDTGGSVKDRLGSYFTKLKNWWYRD